MKTNTQTRKDFLNNGYSVKNVMSGHQYWVKCLMEKATSIFAYENLPSTITSGEIESNLIMKGFVVSVKKFNKIWVPFEASIYGFDAYNVPNQYVYANPRLGNGRGYDLIGGTAAFGWNSDVDKLIPQQCSRLYECIERYANLLAQVESTIYNVAVNKRKGKVGVAGDGATANSLNNLLQKFEVGEANSVERANLISEIQMLDYSDSTSFGELTQTRDYLINCFYNEIGLQTLEEKKERMISGELEVDTEVLEHNLQSMYEQRKIFVDKMNYIYKDILDKPIKLKLNIGGN